MTLRRNRDADALSFRLERAATRIPEVFAHLDEQRAMAMQSSGSGGGGRQPGTYSDPTAGMVAKLDAIELQRRTILDALASIGVGVNILDEACRDALGVRAQPAEQSAPAPAADAEPKCGGGDPSTWGDPTCGQIADWRITDSGHVSYNRDGLCPRHVAKRDEWRRTESEVERRAEKAKRERLRYHGRGAA